MEVHRDDLDRRYEPCPFRCSRCGARAEIVTDVPAGFLLVTPPPKVPKAKAPEPAPLGPRYTPGF